MAYPNYYYFYKIIWPKIDMVVFCFLPACIMILCNVRIVLILRRQRHHFEHYVRKDDEQTVKHVQQTLNGSAPVQRSPSHRKSIERQMSLMMFSCVVVFLCTTMPVTIYLILLEQVIVNYPNFSRDTAYYVFIFRMLRAVMYSHFACNFYLHCLTSRIFRGEFMQTITCRRVFVRTNHEASTGFGMNKIVDTNND